MDPSASPFASGARRTATLTDHKYNRLLYLLQKTEDGPGERLSRHWIMNFMKMKRDIPVTSPGMSEKQHLVAPSFTVSAPIPPLHPPASFLSLLALFTLSLLKAER